LNKNGKDDPETIVAFTEVRLALEKNSKSAKESAARDWALDTQPVVEKAKAKWPQATSFRSGRA
jgi:hypothetical protein